MPKDVALAVVDGDPEAYETDNVHIIYDEIASHFSSTRYKPWPIIANFLDNLPTGWVGLDAGTGNGKYLSLPANRPGDLWTIGMDRSLNLLKIAKQAGGTNTLRELVLGNVLHNCWRAGAFDYAISIATIHHLSTEERRILAIQRLLEAVSPNYGRVLIYVWAIEQDELSKRRVPTSGNVTTGKDVMVPWVQQPALNSVSHDAQQRVHNRYYHMFAKGELQSLVRQAADNLQLEVGAVPENGKLGRRGIEIVQDGWERSNYYTELRCWKCS
ncbi:hypothetical protein AMATHDRAFT_74238 [Amanita thiersii Skay4041]|uniref:Methyltransferase type 11 domain-containing protein n=1 Tax=Amanita thiersii Skay4041 TaxID=703135 RepID=A0A2A9NX52_9AGAR|nr:hypothetical protein AMATHDRAFT_74238 [Amanita thiersii Skay4041]